MTSTLFRFSVGAAIVAFTASPVAAQRGRGAPVTPVTTVQPQGRGPAPKPATPTPQGPKSAASGKPASTPPQSIPDHLANQPELVARLQPLLPPGTDLNAASAGFRNLGEFVAAIHVSHNLGLSFDALKAKITGPNAESLGAAIHDLKPTANAAAEVKTAETAAKEDLAEGPGKQEKHDLVLKSKSSLDELPEHPQLESRIQPLLPAGTNPATAASGFKNLGAFLAAVHVSHDLGIPFSQLKTALTGPSPESLGKAIQTLKPGTSSAAAVQKAEDEARQDLNAVNGKTNK